MTSHPVAAAGNPPVKPHLVIFAQTAAWLRLNLSDQITKRLDALLFHQLVQAAGYQILLVAAQQDAACLFKKYPELLEIQID